MEKKKKKYQSPSFFIDSMFSLNILEVSPPVGDDDFGSDKGYDNWD